METDEKNAAHAHGQGRLKWHPAFFQAVKLELSDYRDFLEFMYEYQLTSEPLRIDLLIIKKLKGTVIDKNIARIFKSDNLMEYKSPEDYLSVDDFLKVYAYANLYAAITPGVDLSEVTLTFVESRHPRKLLHYLTEERGYAVDETSPGIYHISGDYVPIQVIESKRLPEGENLWLKSLANDLEFRGMGTILEAGQKQRGREEIGAYFDLVIRANLNTFLEVQKMGYPTMEEVLTEAGYLPEWLERGRVQGIEQGKAQGMEARELEIAQKMKNAGRPFNEIAEFTGLSAETIERL